MSDLVSAGYGVAHFLDAHEHLLNYGYESDETAQLIFRAHHGVTRLGFRDCFEFQEMGAYFAARHRKSTLAEDRVYGIVQIFNLKIGKANDPFGTAQVRSLEQLEDELGAALNAQNPLMAQLYVFLQPAPPGKGWRAWQDRCSVVKGFEEMNIMGLDSGYRIELSTRNINGVMLGHFKGLKCDYETLYKDRKESDSPLELNMDALEENSSSTGEKSVTAAQRTIRVWYSGHSSREAGLHAKAFGVLNHFKNKGKGAHKGLSVLKLGPAPKQYNWGILLLANTIESVEYWQRVGICQWHSMGNDEGKISSGEVHAPGANLKRHANRLHCQGEGWSMTEGLFG